MRLSLICLVMLCLRTSAQTPVHAGEPAEAIARFESINHQRVSTAEVDQTMASDNFDVKYYRCEWEVDPAVYYITGKVTVYFVTLASANSITFDLMNSLAVDSVKQRNTLLNQTHPGNLLQVSFPVSVNANTLDSLTIYYKGPPANTGFGSFVQTTHAGVPVIWTLSEPYGSRDWWPCRNGLDDKADSIDIIVTCPAAYKAAANGILQSETLINGGTKKVTTWKHRYSIATYLVCFSVTNFSVFNNAVTLGGVNLPMQTFCYPESLASFQAGTQNILDALQLFSNNFGDYPFIREKYGHVQFGWGGGMEHQTSTFVVSINEGLIVHELAHQWFGDKITCGSWEDIWLNEGFATHLASFYMENKYPASTLLNRQRVINNITGYPGGSVWVDDTTSVGRIFDGRLSYNKGSYLLYMLRWKLGDTVFFRGLRQYQKDPKLVYGFARTADLQRNLEQVSGKNLSSFFNEWFKGQGYPSYRVEWTPIGTDHVKIKMSQTTSHPSVPFFELPVALKFRNATLEKTVVVDNTVNGEIFLQNIGFIADTVLIDPELWLLTRNNISVKVASTGADPNTIQVYPNPIRDRFNIYMQNLAAPSATVRLFNAAGQLVYTKNTVLVNGSAFLEVPATNLAAGTYTVSIKAGTVVNYVKKLLK